MVYELDRSIADDAAPFLLLTELPLISFGWWQLLHDLGVRLWTGLCLDFEDDLVFALW